MINSDKVLSVCSHGKKKIIIEYKCRANIRSDVNNCIFEKTNTEKQHKSTTKRNSICIDIHHTG